MNGAGPLALDELVTFAAGALSAAGMAAQVASDTAGFIVASDARGHPSHGIDLLPAYYRGLVAGEIHARAVPEVVHAKGAIAVLDGGGGLGYETSRVGMLQAIELATEHGIGFVTARNCNHFGMASHWPNIAIEHGMIGFVTTNGPPVMAPWGGREHTISNNPFSWGIPAGEELPLLFDMACSATARGKMRIAEQRGESIPLGWALDADGAPTTDPGAGLRGILLPLGGAKGSGIAIMNEVLSAALPGALMLTQVTLSTMASKGIHEYWGIGHSFIALDIAAFGPPEEFLAKVDGLIRELKSVPLADGFEEIRMPGERSYLAAGRAAVEGIDLDTATRDKLRSLATECGVPFPG